MKLRSLLLLLICLSLTLLSACAKKDQTLVVLLPDPDGNVGTVQVSNQQGSQVIEKPRQAVGVDDEGKAPKKPKELKETEIQKIFGPALVARPQQPMRFILYFKSGTSQLSATSKPLVPAIIQAVRDREPADVSIVGHADTVGSKAANIRLSTRRAQIVADFLRDAGLNLRGVEITSHGEAFPVVPTGDNVDEPRNRRVEVTVR